MTYATAAPATAGGNANSPVSSLADVVVMTVRFGCVSKNAGQVCYRLQSISPNYESTLQSTDLTIACMPKLHNEHDAALAPR
jgi:hypothetical protein